MEIEKLSRNRQQIHRNFHGVLTSKFPLYSFCDSRQFCTGIGRITFDVMTSSALF